MNAQEIASKLEKELPHLAQPSQIDKALVEIYNDAKHLAACLDPFVEHDETVKIMNKYFIPWPDPLDRSDKDSKEK